MNIHRYYYPGQIVFITQVLKNRQPIFSTPETIDLIKLIINNVKHIHPFILDAYVILPDHFHILIHPTGQSNFSQILHSIKLNFVRSYKQNKNYDGSLHLWQKRFWDHVIRDEQDLENHLHYIHYNPVKHGYVRDMSAWVDSSYTDWENRGLYDSFNEWNEPEGLSWGE